MKRCSPEFAGIAFCALIAFSLVLRGEAPPPSPPTTRLQIINATCVPTISLAVNGAKDYPDFEQGLYTADAPIPTMSATYVAKDPKSGEEAHSELLKYEPNALQSLVILGDFSIHVPPGGLLQPDAIPQAADKKFPPSVLFRKFAHKSGSHSGGVRLKIINGMPGKLLRFVGPSGAVEVLPGFDVDLDEQPPLFQYAASVDGEEIPILMKQESVIRNAMVIFYLKGGKPTFMRAFEN